MLVCFFLLFSTLWSEWKFLIYDDFQHSLWRDFSKAVTISGNWYLYRWSFVLYIIEHHIISFHWVNRNAPFWTPLLEVHYCNLNVYQLLVSVLMNPSELHIICIFWSSWHQLLGKFFIFTTYKWQKILL